MSILAKKVIQRCVDTLSDQEGVFWTTDELVRYLNDGQREICIQRPDACRTDASVSLVAGSRQTLPAGGKKLISVHKNTSGLRRPVKETNRSVLEAQVPGWHSMTGVQDILHYTFDPKEANVFYVYPPAATGASIDIVYSAVPSDVTEPGAGSTHDDVSGNVSVDDIYVNALQDYILFRAYTKDSENQGHAARAQSHYALFAGSLDIDIKATVAVSPKSRGAAAQ